MERGFFVFLTSLWAVCLNVTFAFGTCAAAADAFLTEKDLTDPATLLIKLQDATPEDVKWAKVCLKLGQRDVSRGKWGAAAKSFGEAAIRRPTPGTMLNMAVAYANMTGTEYPCRQEVEIKLRELQKAFGYFDAGLEMHKSLGPKSDLDDAAIVDFHKKMLDAQKRLLDFQRKCFQPKKSLSSGK